MAFIQMNVPLVFWGQRPPSHNITSICRTEDKKGVATGSRTGQICLWDILKERETDRVKLRPRCLLFGGQSAIVSLCFVKNFNGERDRIVSLSEKGTISLWDGKDGACLKLTNTTEKHTGVKSLPRVKYSETLLALYGKYSGVYILDSNSLEVLCTLKSCHDPNWIAQVAFLSNIEKKDALLAMSVDGVAKHWLLPSRNEMKEQEEIFEEKSQKIDVTNPLSLSSYSYRGFCSALIVCKEAWLLYDATGGKMKNLMIHLCESDVKAWMSGEFIDYGKIAVWAKEDGRCFIYKLSQRCTPGLEEMEARLDFTSTSGCQIQYVLGCRRPSSSQAVYLDKFWHIQGDKTGQLYLWDIRKIKETPPLPATPRPRKADVIAPDSCSCVADSWELPAMPCGLTDMLYPQDSVPPTITCAFYLSTFGRLVCGQADGCIAVLSATQAATVLMLQARKFSRGWPQHCILKGHRGKVNCLLYPSAYSKAYNTDYIVSGGADFTVKLWDLYSGILVHNFAVHGGEIKSIISCPPEINPRLQTCVCSIAEDYSVAILSTSERKCLLVAACHSSPVDMVRWRLAEDFLLVHCIDGKLYVWQIETGSLDRCVEGETARTILSNTPVTSPPTQTLSGSVPLLVRSVSVSTEDSSIQVLLFDPQNLINRLAKMEKSVAAPKAKRPTKQVDAFKTYLSARKNFGLGGGMAPGGVAPGGRGASARRVSMPAVSQTIPAAAISQHPGMSVLREEERVREALGRAVAKTPSSENVKEEGPGTIVNIVRLLLSCLHAWNLDEQLDQSCEEVLGLVRPCRPVSFGLMSKGECMSLVLPGWGLRTRTSSLLVNASGKIERTASEGGGVTGDSNVLPQGSTELDSHGQNQSYQPMGSSELPGDQSSHAWDIKTRRKSGSLNSMSRLSRSHSGVSNSGFMFDQKYHVRWQLSRSLTTQHLLTVVSITNTLMNQSIGAHALASGSGVKRRASAMSPCDEDSDSDSEDSQQMRDNIIRANWSQVAALHCVMLPERMEGKFRAPHLPVLASRFLDQCQAIKEASQALLQAELRRIGPEGRKELVETWAIKLQSPSSFKNDESVKTKHFLRDDDHFMFEGPMPTQQQHSTALIILGMIGAEFHEENKPKGDAPHDMPGPQHSLEVMDPAIARQTAKTLQHVLLEKPSGQSPLHSNLRCSAAELLGRGFQLWEKYIDIALVVMGLLDIVVQYVPNHPPVSRSTSGPQSHDQSADLRRTTHSSSRAMKFASDVAQKALNLMIILRPVTVVTTLAKEVSMYLGSQHVTHFPHSSLQPVQVGMTPPPSTAGIVIPSSQLLALCKNEILDLMKTVIEKCTQQVSLQLLEVVDVVLFCCDQERFKKKTILDIFPSFGRIPNISYSVKSKRLAVGGRAGQVVVYDLKQSRTQMLNAHSHPVTALTFSDDGKMLATYAYADSLLSVWQMSMTVFGISQAPKFVSSWPAISSSSISHSCYVQLEWSGSKSVVLRMPGGMECKYSL